MTRGECDADGFVDVFALGADTLAAVLMDTAREDACELQAAVGLIVEQKAWLGRYEFRQAVDAWHRHDGRLAARVEWSRIDLDASASSGELRILELARSLAGVPSPRSLRDLLWGLDERNVARVLRAVHLAACGTPL